jgi:hypothetical protein
VHILTLDQRDVTSHRRPERFSQATTIDIVAAAINTSCAFTLAATATTTIVVVLEEACDAVPVANVRGNVERCL